MISLPVSQPRGEPRPVARMAFPAALLGLCVFVAVLVVVTLSLRGRLRTQILARDAAVLNSVTMFEVERARAYASSYYGEVGDDDSLLAALLDVSRLDGVVAFRVFDAQGRFLDAAPSAFIRGGVDEADLRKLASMKPQGRFHPHASLDAFFYRSGSGLEEGSGADVPMLEVLVPIHRRGSDELEGVGQFLLDGAPTVAAFAELDRNLLLQAGLASLAALILGGGLLGWAFWRLHHGYLLLFERTRALARANRELALRSRVSAIGAITANLLHGLKNPLAALSLYVDERRRAGSADDGLDDAGEAARRMARMIEDSVAILGQEEGGERFDFTLSEIVEVVLGRCKQAAVQQGVELEHGLSPDICVDNRRGNLLALATVNLVQNAVQASPSGSHVRIALSMEDGGKTVSLQIADSGIGLPEHMRADPFRPVHSGKKGGSGVGLAIAAQLVRQMGGELSLDYTGAKGTAFSIRFPLSEG